MTYSGAVASTPEISGCLQPGLRALASHSASIQVTDTSQLNGSVDLDSCLLALYPREPRWDYSFGYQNRAYFVEVHPASTGQVTTILEKLAWLKHWLQTKAPELDRIKDPESPFIWISTNRNAILSGSKEAKRLAQSKIKNPTRVFKL